MLYHQDYNAWYLALEDDQLAFHTMLVVLILGHTKIWQVSIPCFVVLSQKNLMVETWIHFLSSLHSRNNFLHPFGGISTHFLLPWRQKCGWYPIFLWGIMFLHSQFLPFMHRISPWAFFFLFQVSHIICICSCIYFSLYTHLQPICLVPNGGSNSFQVPFLMT